MEIVYTNRRAGEERVHLELSASEVADLVAEDEPAVQELRRLLGSAATRFSRTGEAS